MRQRPIYLDYHATTPVDPRVASVVVHHLTDAFGNASSADHAYGDEAEASVDRARAQVAALVGAPARSVVFTSGATESINLALKGFVAAREMSRPTASIRIAVSAVEHRAVLDTCHALEAAGQVRIQRLPVDRLGRVSLEAVEEACRDGLDMLCVMAANNEVGNLYPIATVGDIASRYGVALFSDATQAVGKVTVNFTQWGVALLSLSAHKMYGPKGCGALIVSPDTAIRPIIHGGGHQRGLRSGTLNVPGIAGLGEACRLRALEMHTDEAAIERRRNSLQRNLLARIPEIVVNGDVEHRLSGNLHLAVPDVPNAAVVARLRHTVALSTGSACSSGIEAPSHVLQAMGLPRPLQDGALRISLGKFTTDDEVERASMLIADAVEDVRRILSRAERLSAVHDSGRPNDGS